MAEVHGNRTHQGRPSRPPPLDLKSKNKEKRRKDNLLKLLKHTQQIFYIAIMGSQIALKGIPPERYRECIAICF